ncbi:MAG: hypothetical protein ABWY93_02905 [Mycobacterium sp.]
MNTTEPEQQDPQTAIQELIRANTASNNTMRQLIASVQAETRVRDRKVELLIATQRHVRNLMRTVIVVMALVLLVAGLNAYNINAGKRNAAQTAAILERVNVNNGLLLDCLNRTGRCGQVNAEQERQVLNEVKRYELTVIYCARSNLQATDVANRLFLACINRLYPGGPALAGR